MSENRDIKGSGEGQPIKDYLKNLLGDGKPTLSEIPSEEQSLLSEELPEEEEERSSRKRFSQAFGKKRAKEEGHGRLDEKKANKRAWWNGPIGCVVGLAAITGCSVITYCSTQGIIQKLFEGMNWEKPATSEPITFDQEGRPGREEQFAGEITIAGYLREGVWPDGVTGRDIFDNLDPYRNQNYTQWMAFVEICGPQCFLDPDWIPAEGRPAVQELLDLNPEEYDYYHNNPDKWSELINRLRAKYPNDPWLPDLFNITPTDLKSKDQSPFEKWWEDYHPQSLDIHSTRERVWTEGPNWKNPWKGQPSFAGARSKGKGFGTTKGFS